MKRLLSTTIITSSLALFASACAPAGSESGESQLTGTIEDQAEDDLDQYHYTVRNKIIAAAKHGEPSIYHDSNRCDGYYSDYIGKDADGESICLKQINLPSDVRNELKLNSRKRFKNIEGFDTRMTKLYAFKHDGSLDRFFNDEEIVALGKAFDFSPNANNGNDFRIFSNRYYEVADYYGGLTVGEETHEFDHFSKAAWWLYNTIGEDTDVRMFAYDEPIWLSSDADDEYFSIEMDIIISEDHIIFVKLEGWST